MIVTFRQPWKRNRGPFLLRMKKLTIISICLKRRATISIFCQQWAAGYHLAWYFLHSESSKASKKNCSKIWFQQDKMTIRIEMELQRIRKAVNVYLCCWAQQHHYYLIQPTSFFPILLIFLSLIFSLIYLNFTVTGVPKPIFVLSRFVSLFLFLIVPTDKLLIDLGGGGDSRLQ